MLEIIYRIYQVANDETKKINLTSDIGFGLYSSTSKEHNIELLMDCMVCDNREQFKDIIRNTYGESISFRYSKKLKSGDLYCIETFGVILKNMGFVIAREINDRCVTYIKNKNFYNPISIKGITIDSLIGFINSVKANITTIICDPKTYNKIITFPKIINHITLEKNDIVNTPLGITIIKSNALSNEIIGLDKTTGLNISYESKDIVNSNELMSADFGKISYSIKIGYNQIAEGSFARAIIEEK